MTKNRCKSNNLPYIFQNITFSSCFANLWDFYKKIILLFWLYWITSFLFQSNFAEDFRFIILDRIKRVLFGRWKFLPWLIKNSLKKFIFLHKKALLQIIFLYPFLEVKNQNEPIAIKIIHKHKILLMQLNLSLEIRFRKNAMEK